MVRLADELMMRWPVESVDRCSDVSWSEFPLPQAIMTVQSRVAVMAAHRSRSFVTGMRLRLERVRIVGICLGLALLRRLGRA